jgi:hypothetical protein
MWPATVSAMEEPCFAICKKKGRRRPHFTLPGYFFFASALAAAGFAPPSGQ